jgi:hypothetical protein
VCEQIFRKKDYGSKGYNLIWKRSDKWEKR